jgi:hypothetical protein
VLEANSDATDAPATVAANEAVDLPVDTRAPGSPTRPKPSPSRRPTPST